MIYLAFWMADLVQSTLVPSEQKPCLSGGATVTRATSMSIILRRNRWGISHRNIGIVSALPSLTAFLALAPRKREFDLKIPVNQTENWLLVCSNIKKSCSTWSFDFKQAGPVVFTDNFFFMSFIFQTSWFRQFLIKNLFKRHISNNFSNSNLIRWIFFWGGGGQNSIQ